MHMSGMTGTAGPPTVSSLDALWSKLQQQHSREADAARLSRRASSGTLPLPADLKGKGASAGKPAEQEVTPEAGNKAPGKEAGGHGASQGPTAAGQQLSEADFWKMMHN